MTCRDRTPSSHPRARVVVGGSPPFNDPNTSHPFGRGPIDRRAAGLIIAGEEVLLVAKAADLVPAVKAPGIGPPWDCPRGPSSQSSTARTPS
jgi:glycine/D-amino acid oxidase-like deaminating enzyme